MSQNRFPTWSLSEFSRQFGQMKVGSFTNSETGEEFKSCIFVNGDAKTFVAFSSHLGEKSPKEIAQMQSQLQIIQLESGNYNLCRRGEGAWEDVALDMTV